MEKLEKWKNDKNRKPLILKGARQVGKTYILKEFGEKYYHNTVYFNFDHDEKLKDLFSVSKDPKRIIEKLVLISGSKIEPGNTLIIFDEIGECPDALNSLKYFCEETNEYHIVSASSLLGIRKSYTSFPVGKVDFMNLYPMSFSEFLIADGCQNLVSYMNGIKDCENLDNIFFSQLEEKLKVYFIVGGMPEAVGEWVLNKDIEKVNKILDNILNAYESDFSKHTSNIFASKVSLIWNGIPSQLAKENKKFVYQVIKSGARAREYEEALNWLYNANLIEKIYNVSKPAFPLKAYHDFNSFKIYLNDVGLLRKMAGLDSNIILEKNRLFEEFKGSFTENFILNMLHNVYDEIPSYFTFKQYEIDFIIQRKNIIIPIEVKANKNKNHQSLTRYNEQFDSKVSIRFSLDNLKKDGKIINIPLFLVEYINNFLE